MRTGGIIEVILYVTDMQKQVNFYTAVLGLEITYPQGLDTYSDQMWVTFNTGACVLALHGGAKGDLGQKASRIVFSVHDIEQARRALIEKGVKVNDVRSPAPGVMVFDGTDPEGNKFSLESRS